MRVELYGILGEAAGMRFLELESAPARVDELLARLARDYPKLAPHLERAACAVGDQLISRSADLTPGTTLVLLPPVSGG